VNFSFVLKKEAQLFICEQKKRTYEQFVHKKKRMKKTKGNWGNKKEKTQKIWERGFEPPASSTPCLRATKLRYTQIKLKLVLCQ
jgi:hypothetical protein